MAWYASILAPFISAYSNVAHSLALLLTGDLSERELVTEIQSRAVQRIRAGVCPHPESAGLDAVRNCLKSLESMDVVQTYPDTDMIGLTDRYCRDEGELTAFVESVDRFLV